MRILVCAAEAPVPPVDGFRLQLIHLCRQLADRHEVCVLAPDAAGREADAPAGVELLTLPPLRRRAAARAATTARAIVTRWPRRALTLTPGMSAAVRALLAQREFDVAHVAGPPLARVARELGDLPAVLSTLDAWHLNAAASVNVAPVLQRPIYKLEERTVRRFGRTSYRAFSRVVVVSEADAQALHELDPGLDIEVVPNGVDSEYLKPDPAVAREGELVVFTGAMSWPPNVEAAIFLARRVLPLLRERVPAARLAIVGRNPEPGVRALEELDGVEVTGEVADMRPWLWRAGAFACPMISGTGIKNKLLEALACATPAVATPLACQGIEVEDRRHLLVASSEQKFADALATLLADPGLGERMASAGRQVVAERYSWRGVAQAYERIYADILARPRPTRAQPLASAARSRAPRTGRRPSSGNVSSSLRWR